MEVEQFPGNSRSSKEKAATPKEPKPEKVVEKVVSGEVVKRKKSLGRKFKDVFFARDFKTIAGGVVAAVAIPTIKGLVYDFGSETLKRMLWSAERDPRVHRRASGYSPRIQYDRMSSRDAREDPRVRDRRSPSYSGRDTIDLGELIIPSSYDEAEMVLGRMRDIIDTYEVASVADLYELLGLDSSPWTDNKWGWTNLVDAQIRTVREGWLIDLPDPEPI